MKKSGMKHMVVVSMVCFVFSCNDAGQVKVAAESTRDYNYDKPEKTWKLSSRLIEISGNSYISANQLLAIEDETPSLYILSIKGNEVEEKVIDVPVRKKDERPDWEGVAVKGDVAYVIASSGHVYIVSNWRTQPAVEKISTFLGKKDNPEGICFDPVSGGLLIACKGNSSKGNDRMIYRFDLNNKKLEEKPFLKIDQKLLHQFVGKKVDFNPSGIAVHPTNSNIYVLSMAGIKAVLELNREGKVVSFNKVDQLPQPEGICFSPEGDLYISSEGRGGAASLNWYKKGK